MKCMFCGNEESKVVDSRSTEETNAIRRRRECLECGRRFTTYETIEITPIFVVKSTGEREAFNPSKIKAGIMKAAEKRPISLHDIDVLVANIEKTIYNSLEEEVSTREIGEMVMEGLKKLDEVSYIRFAAVYKKFKDISAFFEFINEFEDLIKNKTEKK